MRKIFPLLLLAMSIQHVYAANTPSSLDCTDEEIAGYIDQSGYQKKRGFNTIPNTTEFIKPAIAKTTIEKGAEAGDQCNTIFTEGVDTTKSSEIFDKISGIFSDPVGSMTKAGEMAQERATDIYDKMSTEMEKGICKRLSTKGATESAGDQIDRLYKNQTKDTALSGTRINSSDILGNNGGIGGGTTVSNPSDAIGKNFSYQIIKNQLGQSSSSIAKLLDINNPNYNKNVINVGKDIANDQLEGLEDSIFGK